MLRMKQLVRLCTCFHVFLKCTLWPAAATKAKQWESGNLAKPRPFPLNNRYYSCPSFQVTASSLPSLMVQSVTTFSHFPLNNCSLILHRHKSSSELIGFLSHDNYWYCLFIYFHIKELADILSSWQPIMVSTVSESVSFNSLLTALTCQNVRLYWTPKVILYLLFLYFYIKPEIPLYP